ncbi:SPFH domain-containing protein, partial [Parvibaculum sp.]|uniref:SPFH domain-containing protein n=1 Tax=Parvibaculum sp. TaxID=2024848 RepID=UPI003C71EEDD
MNRSIAIGVGAIAIVAAVIVYLSAFTVSMTQQAIVLQFGDPRVVITKPGLHWKLPVIQNVVYIDKRILNLNVPPEEIIAKDRKRLVVDAFARYKIVDSLRFYQSVGDPRNSSDRL